MGGEGGGEGEVARFTNKGRLELAGRLQLAKLSKCVVPDREVQRQQRTPAACRLHLDLPLMVAGKRQGKGHSPHPQAAPGTSPAFPSSLPSLSPPSFPSFLPLFSFLFFH